MTKVFVDNDETLRHNRGMNHPGGVRLTANLALFGVTVFAQVLAPTFEVASVRPLPVAYRGALSYNCTPGGLFTNAGPIRGVILWAYNIKPYQLLGMPSWDPTVMYDHTGLYQIEARAAGPVNEDVCRTMVQSLLADRFKMATHRETIEMPEYALVIAKNGPKMPKVAESDQTGGVSMSINGREVRSLAPQPPRGLTMHDLAERLTAFGSERPVIDRTGLEGLYKINLSFSIGLAEPPPEAGPELNTALEQQIGLHLESIKAPVDKLVVDRLEKPDAN